MALFRTQVRLAFPIGSGGGTNTWHCRTDEGLSEQDANDMGQALEDFYTTARNLMPTTASFSWDGAFTEIATAEPQVQPTATPWTLAGGGASSFSGAPSMACVTWRSTLASRRGRGRTFIGPLATDSVQSNGTLVDTSRTQLLNAAAALVDASSGLNAWAFGVYSETDGVLRDFVNATVTDQIAILRSRRG